MTQTEVLKMLTDGGGPQGRRRPGRRDGEEAVLRRKSRSDLRRFASLGVLLRRSA